LNSELWLASSCIFNLHFMLLYPSLSISPHMLSTESTMHLQALTNELRDRPTFTIISSVADVILLAVHTGLSRNLGIQPTGGLLSFPSAVHWRFKELVSPTLNCLKHSCQTEYMCILVQASSKRIRKFTKSLPIYIHPKIHFIRPLQYNSSMS
jgi:hypothetical protein